MTEPPPGVLTPEQDARVVVLALITPLLTRKGFGGASSPASVYDLIRLTDYVLTGRSGLDDEPQVEVRNLDRRIAARYPLHEADEPDEEAPEDRG